MGWHYFAQGWQAIWDKKNRRFVVIPILINLALLCGLGLLSYHYFSLFTQWLATELPTWLQWLSYLFWVVYAITFMLISAVLFTWLGNLVGAPFYAMLSEHIQRQEGSRTLPETSWQQMVTQLPGVIGHQLRLLAYIAPRTLIILILSLIPGLNLIATVLWYLFGSWTQSLQYLDYPMDNNGYSVRAIREFQRQHWRFSMSFGAVLLLLMMIPIVNVLVMPAATVGATLMWLEHAK